MPRVKTYLPITLLLPFAACGDNRAAPPAVDARPIPPEPDAAPDASAPRCDSYPIVVTADPAAQAAAAADLATITQTAPLTWNDNTGTLSTIFQLDHSLACPDGTDANAQVIAFLTAHPALFQLDPSEWHIPEFFDCQFVPSDLQILNMGRTKLANHAIARDTLAYSFKRTGAEIVLTSVIGTYLPPAPTGLGDAMTACNDITAGAAETAIRATPLPARTFDQCAPTGDIAYSVHAGDTVELRPDDTWSWEEDTGSVRLTATRTVRVTIAPANYTPDLLASDARCPVTDPRSEDFTVGFDITIDAHTGEILFIKPGLDCVVC